MHRIIALPSPTSQSSGTTTSVSQVGSSIIEVPRISRYNGTVTIGTAEGVPIRLIGRPPKKMGYERTMWSIELAGYDELGKIAKRFEFAFNPSYKVLVEEIARLKTRILKEREETHNSDSDNSSLSGITNNTEGAAAHYLNGGIASTVTSKEELEVLIRGAPSQLLSASDVLSKILPWVQFAERVLESMYESHMYSRRSIFQNLMSILWLRFSDFWEIKVSIRLSLPIPARLNIPSHPSRIKTSFAIASFRKQITRRL